MPNQKLIAANKMLSTFAQAKIERRLTGWVVVWQSVSGEVSKRWQVSKGQSFYPIWKDKYPGGGTSQIALSQLIRWLQDKPVLPISTWKMWASKNYGLIKDSDIDILLNAGYPQKASCVLCGQQLNRGFDWWCLDSVSGPCCPHYCGCKQRGVANA
jgi:hypothetical protein